MQKVSGQSTSGDGHRSGDRRCHPSVCLLQLRTQMAPGKGTTTIDRGLRLGEPMSVRLLRLPPGQAQRIVTVSLVFQPQLACSTKAINLQEDLIPCIRGTALK